MKISNEYFWPIKIGPKQPQGVLPSLYHLALSPVGMAGIPIGQDGSRDGGMAWYEDVSRDN